MSPQKPILILCLIILLLGLSACTQQTSSSNPSNPASDILIGNGSLQGYQITTLPPNAWLFLSIALGLLGIILTAWILVIQNRASSRWLWRALAALFTLSALIPLIWLQTQVNPGIQMGGVVYSFNNVAVVGEIVDQNAYMAALRFDVSAYAHQIEKQLEPLLADHPDLIQQDWQAAIKTTLAREDIAYGYHIPLWEESGHTIVQTITCNILPIHQLSFASIPPIMSIEVPEAGIRLDWFVNTGDYDLDQQILQTIDAATDNWRW